MKSDSQSMNKDEGAQLKAEKKVRKTFAERRANFAALFRDCSRSDILFLLISLTLNFLMGCVMPAFIFLFGQVINEAASGNVDFSKYIVIMAYLAAGAFVVGLVGVSCIEIFAERHTVRLKGYYMRAITKQDMAWFDSIDIGTLLSRLEENCAMIRDAIGVKLGQVAMFSSMSVGGYIVGFIHSWQLALVLFAVMPLVVAICIFLALAMTSAAKKTTAAYKDAGGVAEESLGAMRTVAAFGCENVFIERYTKHLGKAEKSALKGAFAASIAMGLLFFVIFMMYALGFWYGGQLITKSVTGENEGQPPTIQGGDVLIVFFGVLMGAFALGQMGPNMTALIKATQGASDLYEVIDRKSPIDPVSDKGLEPKSFVGDIRFKNATFAYPTRKDVTIFGGLDLHIPAGKTVALVGGSGCGKSTVIQLVQRLYDISGGSLTIDDNEISSLNVHWLRSHIAVVGQEPKLFSTTIAQNISLGKVTTDDNASHQVVSTNEVDPVVSDAAKSANAVKFINKLPLKFGTQAGLGGSQLSGGQKQRIAIARAIVRSAPILILDEATSALDTESEKVVQEALDKLLNDKTVKRTTIIIAHRLSTIRNADKIVVLGRSDEVDFGGSVVLEEGTHDELMILKDGHYKKWVEAQSLARGESGASLLASRSGSDIKQSTSVLSNLASEVAIDDEVVQVESSEEEPVKKLWGCIPRKKVDPQALKPVPYSKILAFVKPDWFMFALGLVASVLNGLVFPGFAIIFSKILGVFFSKNPDYISSESSFLASMFVVIAVGCFIVNTVQHLCLEYCGQRLITRLRKKTFGNLLFQEIGYFDSPSANPGTLSSVLSGDIVGVKGLVGDNTGAGLQSVSALVAGLIIAFVNSPQLAGVILAAFIIIVPCSLVQSRFMHAGGKPTPGAPDDKKHTDPRDPSRVMNETLTSIRTVAAFGLENYQSRVYEEALDLSLRTAIRNALIFGFFWGLSQAGNYGAQALSLWYGGIMVTQYGLDPTAMMMTIFALMFAATGSGQASLFMTDSKKAKESAKRVFFLMDRESKIDARDVGGQVVPEMKGLIEVEGVNFRYPQRPTIPVYDELTFAVKPGQVVALVGTSGCGKSTVVNLLERFYGVDEMAFDTQTPGETSKRGCIKIDGIDIREYNLKFLRSCFALVSQEPVLFDCSINENIRMGKLDATQEEIQLACKRANAESFINEFPDRYDTVVGKQGSKLSGGQKQRIAIARAIIRNPKLLILDEATSALDTESEQIVQAALDSLLEQQKYTTIVIAHRLKTIADADSIVVLDAERNKTNSGSKVVEVGTHQELMEIKNGVYKNLVELSSAGRKRRKSINAKEDK